MRTRIILMVAFALCGACMSLHAQWTQLAHPADTLYAATWSVIVHKDWFLAGTNNGVYRTDDPAAENAWVRSSEGLNARSVSLLISDGDMILARTNAGMRVSTDDGATWSKPAWSPDSGVVFSFVKLDETWYMGGSGLAARKSTDKGASWTLIADAPGLFVFTRKGHWHLRQEDEGLWRTTDEGATWSQVNTMPFVESKRVLWVTSHNDVFYSNNDIIYPQVYRSTDEGATFTLDIPSFGSLLNLDEIGGALFARNQRPQLYRSLDRGASWSVVPTPFDRRISSINIVAGFAIVSLTGGSLWWTTSSEFMTVADVEESVSGERAAVSGERVIRGSVPWTTLRVEHDTDVEVYNVLGERVGVHHLSAGEHTLHTPEPCLLRRTP